MSSNDTMISIFQFRKHNIYIDINIYICWSNDKLCAMTTKCKSFRWSNIWINEMALINLFVIFLWFFYILWYEVWYRFITSYILYHLLILNLFINITYHCLLHCLCCSHKKLLHDGKTLLQLLNIAIVQ